MDWYALPSRSTAEIPSAKETLQLVPLTPTALENKVGIPEEQSKLTYLYRWHVGETDADPQVQSWNSILLALYSAAFLFFSRKTKASHSAADTC